MIDGKLTIGMRVQIIRQDIAYLRHRLTRNSVYGFITRVDGEYVYVRPTWCKWEIELYRNELASV